MKVLVIGSGGREHVLAWKISESPKLTKLYAAPGNAGISEVAECCDIKADDIEGLLKFAKEKKIDLTVVGPEAPLAAGIVDTFEQSGLTIFGPSKNASELEGSKAFAKEKMASFGIPTAAYKTFTDINDAKQYVIETEMPIVIKADGLAAGKGVIICETAQDAVQVLTQIMAEGVFGESGNKVVIEKKLEGDELSVLALSDGKKIIPLASSQDHKRVYDNDRGPNTGGMGAYSPCPLVDEAKLQEIIDLSVRPMIEGLAKEGIPYRGVIYAGLMLTKDGPFVLEYNCRFGDPEAQVVLPRLKSDLLPVLHQIAKGKLTVDRLDWHEKACLAIVVSSGGYPGHYETGFEIQGIAAINEKNDAMVFHAGTAESGQGGFKTAGGRVLAVTALGSSLKAAFDYAYELVSEIKFQGSFYRRDIGRKALEVLK